MSRRTIAPNTTAEQIRSQLEATLEFLLRHNNDARNIAIETIDCLKRHLLQLGVDRSLTRPLNDIAIAFAELERGRLLPLFEPKQLGHKPPTDLNRLYVMAKASLAIDLLMAAKVKRDRAAREVATVLRKHGFPIKGKLRVPAWKTVIGWREKLRKSGGSKADAPGKFIYQVENETYAALIKDRHVDPKALAKLELKRLGQSLEDLG